MTQRLANGSRKSHLANHQCCKIHGRTAPARQKNGRAATDTAKPTALELAGPGASNVMGVSKAGKTAASPTSIQTALKRYQIRGLLNIWHHPSTNVPNSLNHRTDSVEYQSGCRRDGFAGLVAGYSPQACSGSFQFVMSVEGS
jgi:hypothetical protein